MPFHFTQKWLPLLIAIPILASACVPDRGRLPDWTLKRSDANPLITASTPGIADEWGYNNINGPSVIRVPQWVQNPRGKYYLYFAHHRGSFIRMAYADAIDGPWTIYEGGVLQLKDTPALDHIASPDVLVNDETNRIEMFFHSVDDTSTWKQTTYRAISDDGLDFTASETPVGPPYLRAFRVGEQWWAIAKVRGGPGGVLLRSDKRSGPFEEGPLFLDGMRHGTVLRNGTNVDIVFSRIGDKPERLLRVTIDPPLMWAQPYEPEIVELLRPERDYEGGNLPVAKSAVGEASEPVNALRDPYLFVDTDGTRYLFYSIAGESGIAVARL